MTRRAATPAALLDATPVVAGQAESMTHHCYDVHQSARGNAGHVHQVIKDPPGVWTSPDWRGLDPDKLACIITGLPEPSRGWLSARGEAQGRAETGEAVVDGLRSILAGIGAATARADGPAHACPAR